MVTRKEFAQIISGRREKKGYTQRDLSRILHMSVHAICNWETGKSLPLFIDGLRLCKALGISADDLMNR